MNELKKIFPDGVSKLVGISSKITDCRICVLTKIFYILVNKLKLVFCDKTLLHFTDKEFNNAWENIEIGQMVSYKVTLE
jgi:hypothetical protein